MVSVVSLHMRKLKCSLNYIRTLQLLAQPMYNELDAAVWQFDGDFETRIKHEPLTKVGTLFTVHCQLQLAISERISSWLIVSSFKCQKWLRHASHQLPKARGDMFQIACFVSLNIQFITI